MTEVGAAEALSWVWLVGTFGFGAWAITERGAPPGDWPWFCIWPVILPVILVCELIAFFQRRTE